MAGAPVLPALPKPLPMLWLLPLPFKLVRWLLLLVVFLVALLVVLLLSPPPVALRILALLLLLPLLLLLVEVALLLLLLTVLPSTRGLMSGLPDGGLPRRGEGMLGLVFRCSPVVRVRRGDDGLTCFGLVLASGATAGVDKLAGTLPASTAVARARTLAERDTLVLGDGDAGASVSGFSGARAGAAGSVRRIRKLWLRSRPSSVRRRWDGGKALASDNRSNTSADETGVDF